MFVAVIFHKNNLKTNPPSGQKASTYAIFSEVEATAVQACSRYLQTNYVNTAPEDYTILVGELNMQVADRPIAYELKPAKY